MSVVQRLVVHGILIASVAAGAAAGLETIPGTQYPAQKIVFTDPLTGKIVWRMTTDGSRLGALHLAPGDQSSESRSFSLDSTQIVYAKSGVGASKPDGIYLMDIQSGIETYLAPAPYYASPVFARDGSNEVYYYYGRLEVRAVDTVTYAVRTVVTLPGASWQEKIEVNADGSYLAVHPRMADGSYRTVIVTPQGAVHPNWTLSGPTSDDGAQWSPTDRQWICAVRNGQGKFWNIQTLATKAAGCTPAHTAWHPNGAWHYSPSYLTDISTGAAVLHGTGIDPIHPNINPAEGALGVDARIIADDRNWFRNNTGRPRLSVRTIRDMMADFNYYTKGAVAVHYSSMANNYAHVHAHWSWDGNYILWTSDVADLRDGTPPGGTGRGSDLFILPMGSASTSTQQVVNPSALSVNPASLAFSAVQGGAAPAAQSLAISNTGTGTLTWTVSDDAAWLSVSAVAGAGNATLSVTATPSGLAPGTYIGAITVSAGDVVGSPQIIDVSLIISPALPPTISQVSPTSGTTEGGTLLQIEGTGLDGETVVKIGDELATDVTVLGPTRLRVVTPPGHAGLTTLVVTSLGGSATAEYSYIPAASILFADAFNDGDVAGWTVSPLGGQANWNAATGALEYNGLGHTQLFTGGAAWTDYSVEAKFRLFSLANYPGGLRGRVDPLTGTGYEVWLFPATSQIALFRVTGWSIDSPGLLELGRATVAFDTTNFHTLRLTFTGPTIQAHYDGIQVIDATGGQYTAGAIALDVSNQRIQWDDVLVVGVAPGSAVVVAPHPPILTVAPSTMTFNALAGTFPKPQFLQVIGGDGSFDWVASPDASWLTVTPSSGTAPSTVTIAVDATGLGAETYIGAITVAAGEVSGSPQTVVVTLAVTPALGLAALTSDLSAPQSLGTTITFTAFATVGVPPYQYKWWIFDGVNWDVAENWTTSPTFIWTPAIPNSDYRIGVWVRSAENSADIYDRVESAGSIPFLILP